MQLKVWNACSKKQQFTSGLRKKHMESKFFFLFLPLFPSPEQYLHMKHLNQDHKQNHAR